MDELATPVAVVEAEQEELTPQRKAKLQAPRILHGKRRTWVEEAFDEIDLAIELGELE